MVDPRRIPPAAWIAGGVVLVVVVGVLGASYVSMRRRSDIEMCGVNLRTIYVAIRSGDPPDSPKWNETGTGRAFLAGHPQWPTHEPRPIDLNCPVLGRSGQIDYRGPARPLPQMRSDEPILSDRPGNHGAERGGNVVLKTGAIFCCEKADPLWAAAERSTSD